MEAEAEAEEEENSVNLMAHTVISVKLPPNIDPTKSRLAYGDRELPKLVRACKNNSYFSIQFRRSKVLKVESLSLFPLHLLLLPLASINCRGQKTSRKEPSFFSVVS